MADTRPRKTKRSPRNAAWKASLTPMQQDLADRLIALAGQSDFAVIALAHASAQRKPGPDYLTQRWPLLLEMEQVLRSNQGSSVFAAAKKIARKAKATNGSGLPEEDSLRRWLFSHYQQHNAALAAQIERELDVRKDVGLAACVQVVKVIPAVLRSPGVTERFARLQTFVDNANGFAVGFRQGIIDLLRASFVEADPPRLTVDT